MKSVIRVTNFSGKNGEINPDKNGKNPVYLNYISGSPLPAKARVLSGTIAEGLGLELGKTYIVNTEEGETSAEYGVQYNTTVVTEMSGTDLINLFSNELKTTVRTKVEVKENAPAGAGVGQ